MNAADRFFCEAKKIAAESDALPPDQKLPKRTDTPKLSAEAVLGLKALERFFRDDDRHSDAEDVAVVGTIPPSAGEFFREAREIANVSTTASCH